AVGRILSPPYQKPHPDTGQPRWIVDVVYDYLVVPNYARPKILADSDREFNQFKPYVLGLNQTVFYLPPSIAARTDAVLRPYLRPIGTSHRPVDKRVFVSYSREDSKFALKLVDDLRQRLGGHKETVWLDTQQLEGGQTFQNIIEDEIR